MDISKHKLWEQSLEKKDKKIKKKDLEVVLTPYIISEKSGDGHWITGKNFNNRVVEIHCKTREECLINLATMNGITNI